MMYRLNQTMEAKQDIKNLAVYMKYSLKNGQAANSFLNLYYEQIESLKLFPFAYRGVGFKYKDYEIRMKVFSSYNILFTVDVKNNQIIILRVLNERQNWKVILCNVDEYNF